jgi:hypothetical protein
MCKPWPLVAVVLLLLLLLQLSALVVSQLLQRCPDMSSSLRAACLIGDTEPGGRSSCLSMDTKVCGGVCLAIRGDGCCILSLCMCGDTEPGGRSSCLSMDTKVWRGVFGEERSGAFYVLSSCMCGDTVTAAGASAWMQKCGVLCLVARVVVHFTCSIYRERSIT